MRAEATGAAALLDGCCGSRIIMAYEVTIECPFGPR
jgi:hypothetical protein